MAPDHGSLLRRAYRSVGLGIGEAMMCLFGQGAEGGSAWTVVDLVSGRRGRSRPVVAEDLFGSIPAHWEIMRVETGSVRTGEARVVVTGHICCRPRGMRSYDLLRVPFAHVWTLRGTEAVRVLSYLDGIELRRA